MKCPFYIFLLLCGSIWLTSCTGPVILEEKEEPGNQTGQEDTPTSRDSVAIIHEGTYTSPYSIAEAQTLGRGKRVWVEGYIVGCVSGSMKSGCNFTAEATTAANILLADTFPTGSDNDYLYCMPVELPNGSTERDELNLYDHPDHYHRKVRIEGDITLYYKVAGMKELADYIFCDEVKDENEDEGDNEDENEDENESDDGDEDGDDRPYDPDATRQDTLSIAEAIKIQKEDGYEQACIRGYIIGYAKGNNSVVYVDSTTAITRTAERNVVLADHIDERDKSKIIVVQLPEGVIRSDVNLYANPQNLHKRLTVTGMMTYYYGLAGCTGTLGTENRERFLLE